MTKIAITNQEEREDVMMWVSDLYKDVYGFRPRCYNFNAFSNAELADFVNDLAEESEREAKLESAAVEKAIADVMALGADKETALRWLDQADAHFMYGDDTFYEDGIEKYGWLASHFDNKISKK
tara:strand:+ start:149 stop:520 length:372 start_codon:yes stop_codon:yes gene_type:complete